MLMKVTWCDGDPVLLKRIGTLKDEEVDVTKFCSDFKATKETYVEMWLFS